MGMILTVSSQGKKGRAKEFVYNILKNTSLLLVRFTLFWVATLKSILNLGVQKLKRIRIQSPFNSIKNSENPKDTFEEKSVCVSNEILQHEKIDSDIEVNTDSISGFRNAEQDIFESSNTEETIVEIENCEEIGEKASESLSYKRSEISNQSVVMEDFMEETHTDYLKNFSLYSVLFLPAISIQFYLSVLLLLFYAYRKKLFAKYLGNDNESNRVEETESNTFAQSEDCEENTEREMPLDSGSQQVTIERSGIEGKENDQEKSDESMILSEALSNAHEIETLINVIIPDNSCKTPVLTPGNVISPDDLGKAETRNIINECVESKMKKDVAREEHTLDNLEEIRLGTENEEMVSILAKQENQIIMNNDELLVRNEIRNSITSSDKDSKEDAEYKSSKTKSNKLVIAEKKPNEAEQISVSGRKGNKSTSCLADENKKGIQSENPKMRAETINNEFNEEVCFRKDETVDARALKETKTRKDDKEKDSTNNVRERSNQQSKKPEEYNSNGLLLPLTDNFEMGETKHTEENTREVQNKEGSLWSFGDNPVRKDLSMYGTDRDTLENLNEESNNQGYIYEEAVSNIGDHDTQTTTSVSNDGIRNHVEVNSMEFENIQDKDRFSKGELREINIFKSDIEHKGTENVEMDLSKPRMKENNSNDLNGVITLKPDGNVVIENISIENKELRPGVEKATFRKEKSLDEDKVLDILGKTNADLTCINTEKENTEKVICKKELNELVNKDEDTKGLSIFDHKKSTSIYEEIKAVSDLYTERENNEDQVSLWKFSKGNDPDCQEAFECSENSRQNERFEDSVVKETLNSENIVHKTSYSAANSSLKLICGPFIFQTNVDDGSKFAFKFRSEVKSRELNKKANRSCEIRIKKF